MDVPIDNGLTAKVYRASGSKRIFWLSAILAAYAVSLPFAYFTAGEPREAAILRAQQLEDEKWTTELAESALSGVINATTTTPTSPLDSISNKAFESQEEAMTDEEQAFLINAGAESFGKSRGWFSGWGMSEEEKKMKRRHRELTEKMQKKLRAAAGGDDLVLPPWYLPSAWACLALFATLTVHALFHLLCMWLVNFRAAALFSPVQGKVALGDSVLVRPPANRGKAEFVPVQRAVVTGDMKIDFQRQTYTYSPAEQLGAMSAKLPNGVFFVASAPVSEPISKYLTSTGFKQDSEIARAKEKWGTNVLSLPTPSFIELLKEQLTRPLAIFQVFCALLWLLDEYWTYTMWTLVSVVVFEAVTVFQRTKTQTMLGGMAPKPSSVYVYRCGRWSLVTSDTLLPGDIISVAYKCKRTKRVEPGAPPTATPHGHSEVVPCDCLLLTGSAVANEASLTGESVPQMKEALVRVSALDGGAAEEKLDMNDTHRVNILFSGTSLVTVDGAVRENASPVGIPTPPDKGAIAYVLRTGFSSSQGNLLQMIEFSQQTVSGDTKEMAWALLLLLGFALVASGYVLKEGLRKKEKTTHEILLKCVIIITSVVPRQLPMQMAMAVNMALMALMKAGIFCTEPFRVPLAGNITHCFFDKTGTLTTDQLVPVGVVNISAVTEETRSTVLRGSGGRDIVSSNLLAPVKEAAEEAAIVLAACHSLVVIEEAGDDDDDTPDPNTASSGASGAAGPRERIGPQLVGDPIELAAIKGVEWSWNALTSTATPGHWEPLEKAKLVLEGRLSELRRNPPPPTPPQPSLMGAIANAPRPPDASMVEKQIANVDREIQAAKAKAARLNCQSVQVMHRHYFSSSLQRMSVVCKVNKFDSVSWHCLVKGSPEAIGSLLREGSAPEWYSECYRALARRGLRVLALAYRQVDSSELQGLPADLTPTTMSRDWVEKDLTFCGFIAFECKIRADSPIVISALRDSDHSVTMLTGDSPLTSIHVAKEVNICDQNKQVAVLMTSPAGSSADLKVKFDLPALNARWVVHLDDGSEHIIPFASGSSGQGSISEVIKTYDLVTTEADFLAIADAVSGANFTKAISDGTLDIDEALGNVASSDRKFVSQARSIWNDIGSFRVFARMSPQGKRYILAVLQKLGKAAGTHVLMCGDGGNDVGALKQANVGIALLAGHANANTTEKLASKETDSSVVLSGTGAEKKSAEDTLNAHDADIKARAVAVDKMRQAHMKVWSANYQKVAQAEMQAKIKELTEKGEYSAMFSLMKDQAGRIQRATQAENARFMAQHGQIWDPKSDTSQSSQNDMMSMFGIDPSAMESDSMNAGGLPMVRPGDASVAAPFTSRIPSVRAVVDLIRQGRCTLLSALMQEQIMMLESIISAYTLSALSLHNARSSERQMMASSWLIMTAAVSFSYASPVDKMHPQRPLSSLFHPAIIISILGQAAIHIACMTLAVQWATDAMGPELLKEVTEFFKKAKAKQLDTVPCDEDDYMCIFNQMWQAPFMPNLLNSTVFLVETSQMISVFFANYKGRPWMKGMLENHALFLSVFLCIGGVIVASWEVVPQLNEAIQLAPFPNDWYRYKVVLLVMATIAGTFLWDRLCTLLFSPAVFGAMVSEATKTTPRDLMPILMTVIKIVGVILILSTGNILLWGGAFYMYRKYYSNPAPAQTTRT